MTETKEMADPMAAAVADAGTLGLKKEATLTTLQYMAALMMVA